MTSLGHTPAPAPWARKPKPPPESVDPSHRCSWPITGDNATASYCREPVRVREWLRAPYCPRHCNEKG